MTEPDPILAIDDPHVPDVIREHAARFRTPVAWVEDLGYNEYALLSKDGELIDLVVLTGP